MNQGNLEKFIIDLGFSDKKAITGLKSFLKKVDNMKANVKVNVDKSSLNKISKDIKSATGSVVNPLKMSPEMSSHVSKFRKSEAEKQLAHEKALHHERKRNIAAEKAQRERADRFKNSSLYRRIADSDPSRAERYYQQAKTVRGSNTQFGTWQTDIRNAEKALGTFNRKLKQTTVIQRGLSDSTRNMIRSYASVYALGAGGMAINKVGRTFEGAAAAMKAVSTDSKEAEANLKFLKDEAKRLGLGVGESTKNFVKLRAAIGDKASNEEARKAFTNLSETGTVFQLRPEEMNRTIKA